MEDDTCANTDSDICEGDIPFLEALHLDSPSTGDDTPLLLESNCPCLFPYCEETFQLPEYEQNLWEHLALQHKMVIHRTKEIANIKSYVDYWKDRLKSNDPKDFCTVMLSNCGPKDTDPKEEYLFMSEVLPEEKELRERLQKENLNAALSAHQLERSCDSFSRRCLFCKEMCSGNRSSIFTHLATMHNFHVGNVDNIVYCHQMLDVIADKLNKLQCLYCEKVFKDRSILLDHMRKKKHKRIHPNNTNYDRFYIVNYLGEGERWREREGWDDWDHEEGEGGWGDWEEEKDKVETLTCLFCKWRNQSKDILFKHMEDKHLFNFSKITQDLDFYSQVKMINFVRRQIHSMCCPLCRKRFTTKDILSDHMKAEKHCGLPSRDIWNQVLYLFPTFEGDNLLSVLDCDDSSSYDQIVVAEEMLFIRQDKNTMENVT